MGETYTKQPVVLHIEDDEDYFELVRRNFKKFGKEFNLIRLKDGQEAKALTT